MQVERIKATIRYSQDTGCGAWRSLEIGAEALLEPGETLEDAQPVLYEDLRAQFKALWQGGAKGTAVVQQAEQEDLFGDAEPQPEPPAHWCEEHRHEHKRREKDGRVWYSHYLGDGQYCNEGR